MTPLADLLAAGGLPDGDGDKTERGTLVVVGGPPSCPGGVVLAGTAALRAGAGRVLLVVHPEAATAVAVAVPEAAVLGWSLDRPMPQELADRLGRADAVAIGPGCGHGIDEAVAEVAAAAGPVPLVLDAGALAPALDLGAASLVLAPNTSEARDLLVDDDVTGADPVEEATLARALAARLGAPAAVRGPACAVADATGATWVLERTPPGLGTPGSGDVFVGVLTALLAAGAKPVAALAWAVALHTSAGARLALHTPSGYLARDLLTELPAAIAAQRSSSTDGGEEEQ